MSWIDNKKLKHIRPYLKIMRMDNITGSFLLLSPCLWSIGFAMDQQIPWLNFIFFIIGAIIMRCAGCVINDIVDRKLDAKVERTKNRPLANGDMKLYEAILLLFLLFVFAFIILLTMNSTTIMLGFIVIIPLFAYPFMKRITYWPQIFLGLTINWGALMGWASVTNQISIQSIMLYSACVFWTLGYDTIYAHQDKKDDILHGIKSTALKFGIHSKKYIYAFYSVTIILLWVLGIMKGLNISYHILLLIGAFQLFWQVNSLEEDEPNDCMRKFSSNRYFGMLIFAGVMLGQIRF